MTQAHTDVPPSLGICVTTQGSTRHVLGLARAAVRAGTPSFSNTDISKLSSCDTDILVVSDISAIS